MSQATAFVSSTPIIGFIEVTPKTLVYSKSGGIHKVIISNLKEEMKVTWKLKTNHPERYKARPKFGVLEPGEKVSVKIQVDSKGNTTVARSRDRFLIFGSVWTKKNSKEIDVKEVLSIAWKELELKHKPKLSKHVYQVITLFCKESSDLNELTGQSFGPDQFELLKQYVSALQRRNSNLQERLKLAREKTMRLETAVVNLRMLSEEWVPTSWEPPNLKKVQREPILEENAEKAETSDLECNHEEENCLKTERSRWYIFSFLCGWYICWFILLGLGVFLYSYSILVINPPEKHEGCDLLKHEICLGLDYEQLKENTISFISRSVITNSIVENTRKIPEGVRMLRMFIKKNSVIAYNLCQKLYTTFCPM